MEEIFVIVFSLLVLLIIFIAVAYLAVKEKQRKDMWASRVVNVNRNKDNFYNQLRKCGFTPAIDYSYFATYTIMPQPIEVFAFKADIQAKKLVVASHEDGGKVEIFNFNEIKSFSILDGEKSTNIYSDSIGGYAGTGVGGVIMSSTTSNQSMVLENICLKIETTIPYSAPHIFCIYKYQVAVASEAHRRLSNTLEMIKSFLSDIIEENRKQI